VAANQHVALVGPSGCGKTTLLRIVAGLEGHNGGNLRLDAQARIAMVFQQGLLFPWMSVMDNIGYGLLAQGVDPAQCQRRSREWVSRLGLQRFADAYPHQLSGGMQQRVGLARALVVEPDILLLDEPFAALDAQTRLLMQELLVELADQRAFGTMLFVTHAIDEALVVAERVVVMSARPGRIVADLTPDFAVSDPQQRRALPLFQSTFDHIWQLIRAEVAAQLYEGAH
jgi:NitT/TauT family transport system ATP-binding protein